jgi:sec-independent protein translocase protein TatA
LFTPSFIFGLGVPELVIILVIVLLIFGAPAIPKLGKAIGETVSMARKGMEKGDEDEEEKKDKKKIEKSKEDK